MAKVMNSAVSEMIEGFKANLAAEKNLLANLSARYDNMYVLESSGSLYVSVRGDRPVVSGILSCAVYNREIAEEYAAKIFNGNGEKPEVVLFKDALVKGIAMLEKLIADYMS